LKKIYMQRIGARDAFSWPFFAVFALGYGAAELFLSYLPDPLLSPLWLSVWLLGQLAVLLMFFFIKTLLLDGLQTAKVRPWLNLAIVGLVGGSYPLVTNSVQSYWGLPTSKDLLFDALASSALSLVLFGLTTSLLQSFKQNQATMASLLQAQARLLALRESAELVVLEEELRLVRQTQAALMPQLELLDASLESTGFARTQRRQLIHDIRNTIETQVRPLSDELKSSAQTRALPLTSSRFQPTGLRAPGRLALRDAFRPGEIFSMALLGFVATPYILISPIWGGFGFIAAIHYGLWLLVIRTFIPARLSLKTPIGVLLLTLLALVPLVPVLATLFAYAPETKGSQVVHAALTFMVVVVTSGLAILHGLYQELDAGQLELKQRIAELRRETSRFEQQLWSARRNWGYVIHGTVQASLTAALMHLQNAQGSDEAVIKVVRKDIRRAANALRERPLANADLQTTIAELTETWAGVCDLEVRVSDDARKALLADADLCHCTREILKESVVNAVRHGGATSVSVSLTVEDGHTLLLEAVNNGCALNEAAEAGLGSQIIQDLSYFWSIESDEGSGLTSLVAKMALPRAGGA
jgi:signal transduction histidine kinase